MAGVSARLIAGFAAVYLLAILAIAFCFALNPADKIVAWPIGAIAITAAAFIAIIRWRDRAPSYFEIGVVYAGIVALYGAYPPFAAALSHFEFGPTKDARFIIGQPLPTEMASISWWYAIYLAAFCTVYLLARPRHSTRREPLQLPGRAIPVAAAILLVVTKLFTLGMDWFFDLHPATYSEQYVAARSLPMFWRQMANIFEGMGITLQILLLASLFCYYRRTRWLIVAFVVTMVSLGIMRRGARTDIAVVILAALQLRDQLVRRVPAKVIAVAAAAGFVVYIAMGILRIENRELRLPTFEEISGSYTDFEGVFANAYDLKYLLNASGAFRGHPSLLLADVVAIFPQQVVPFVKTSASKWYVMTYYKYAYVTGAGLAFGVVPEAIVGYGIPELLLRGAFVGLFLALLQRWYVSKRAGVILLTFYVWGTITAYQMCRNTTLSIVSMMLYRFGPAVAATLLLAAALRHGRVLRRSLLSARLST